MPDARERTLLQQQLCELLRLVELRTFYLSHGSSPAIAARLSTTQLTRANLLTANQKCASTIAANCTRHFNSPKHNIKHG